MKCGHEGISAFVVTRSDPAEDFQAADSISVIGLVREDDDILRQRRQEPSSLWRISGVPARQPESQ